MNITLFNIDAVCLKVTEDTLSSDARIVSINAPNEMVPILSMQAEKKFILNTVLFCTL